MTPLIREASMSSHDESDPMSRSANERRQEWGASAATRERIRFGIEEYDDPFVAYLMLPDVDLDDTDLIDDFMARYCGTFAGAKEALDSWVDSAPMSRTLEHYVQIDPDNPSRVSVDYGAVAADVTECCHFVELGGIHAFARRLKLE